MAKILISPLGTGASTKKTLREYRKANYRIDNKDYESSFIASVLYKHLNLDGIIFIGTVRSMWEEVYRFFCDEKNVEFDEEYYWELSEQIESLNYSSQLVSLNLSQLEGVLGQNSQCILTRYGLDQAELWENFDTIIQSIHSLKAGDEIYIDITHSFRSSSIFQFLTITFITDLLSDKKIEIAGVYYGMLEVSRELDGFTPIVDLKPLFEMTRWIKGAYNLKNYGNGDLIANLLEQQGEGPVAEQVRLLSQSININYVTDIKQRSSALKSALARTAPSGPFSHLRKILEEFTQKFARTSMSESEYQLELSSWYFDNQRYATGYITLAEAIITYLCEINQGDPQNRDFRKTMQDYLHDSANQRSDLAKLYFKVNPIRNSIAHASLNADVNRASFAKAIKDAKSYQQEAKRIFTTQTLNKQ